MVRHLLGGVAGFWPVSDQTLDDLRIAVTEACANVVVHAYPNRTDGLLEVAGGVDGSDIVVTVRDQGIGMRQRTNPPSLGIGLKLIGALTSSLELAVPHGGGQELRMTFAGQRGTP